MNEDPYKVVTKLADKYSRGRGGEYTEVLNDLRELMVLQRLDTCLQIKAHRVNVESEIFNIRLIREREAKQCQ